MTTEPDSSPPTRERLTLRDYFWDKDSHLKSPAERRLLLKLDLAILTFGCLGFFLKFLDQTNMINAYVSGMREDLEMFGNEYTYAQTAYTVAYAIMQVPSTLIVQKVRPRLWLALMEVGWGIWTFAQASMTSSTQLYVFRFLVGFFEASFSPVMLYMIGSWYTKTEMAKRAAIFQMTAPIGTAFSGFMQAAIHESLNGAHGLAGWRWLYIVCGCMTVPVGLATYWMLPDTPFTTNIWFLTEEDKALALERVKRAGVAAPAKITGRTFLRIFSKWRWYAFVLGYTLYGSSSMSGGFFAIYLKSEGYPVAQTNAIPTATWIISGITSVVWGYLADYTGNRFLYVLIPLVLGLLPNGILAFWPDSLGLKMFAFLTIGVQLMPGVFFSWAMEVCREDNEERAVVASSMNGMSFAIVAWLPVVIFPQTMAPDFRYGYPASWGLVIAAIFSVFFIHYRILREEKSNPLQVDENIVMGSGTLEQRRILKVDSGESPI